MENLIHINEYRNIVFPIDIIKIFTINTLGQSASLVGISRVKNWKWLD